MDKIDRFVDEFLKETQDVRHFSPIKLDRSPVGKILVPRSMREKILKEFNIAGFDKFSQLHFQMGIGDLKQYVYLVVKDQSLWKNEKFMDVYNKYKKYIYKIDN